MGAALYPPTVTALREVLAAHGLRDVSAGDLSSHGWQDVVPTWERDAVGKRTRAAARRADRDARCEAYWADVTRRLRG